MKAVSAALRGLMSRTCLNFTMRTDENNYTVFTKGPSCAASVGMQGRKQYVFITKACSSLSQIGRHLMHTLGFHSEVNRPDRDRYIEINWQNIRERYVKSFRKYPASAYIVPDSPFDYQSVSHFDGTTYALDPSVWTIRSRNNTVQLHENSKGFSEGDVWKINEVYCRSPGSGR